jgi:hypothetical protein
LSFTWRPLPFRQCQDFDADPLPPAPKAAGLLMLIVARAGN